MSDQHTRFKTRKRAASYPQARLDAHKYLRIELSDGTERALRLLLVSTAELLGVKRVGLALFDDRRAHYRLTEGYQPGTFEREEVICNRVFSSNDSVVCADVTNSPDLVSFPVVEKKNVRFYTGVPLHDEDGAPIGTICGWEKIPLEIPTPETLTKVEGLAFIASTLIQGEGRSHISERARAHWQNQALLEQTLLDVKNDVAVLLDQDLRIVYATPLFLNLVRRRIDEIVGLQFESFLESSTPLDFQGCINQVLPDEPIVTTVRLRGKGTKSIVKRMRLHKSLKDSDNSEAPCYVVAFTHAENISASPSSAQFRRQLIQASRNGLPAQARLDRIVSLVNSRIRGSDNVTIVSVVTGPKTRKILHQEKAGGFIRDLGQHHSFDPELSICATTAASNRYLFCPDSLLEDRWPDYEWLFYAHGIRSVWCMPVPSDEGLPPGLLTVFRKEVGAPDSVDLETLEECVDWVSTLLLRDVDLPESPNPPPTTLQNLEQHLEKQLADTNAENQNFLVAINASALLEAGATQRQILELINLYFSNPQKVFKLRRDLWCWLSTATDRFATQGAMEKLDIAAQSVQRTGQTQRQQLCSCVPVISNSSIAAAIASLGRHTQESGQAQSFTE